MLRCIMVRLVNRVSGQTILVDGYHSEQALSRAYPLGLHDPLYDRLPFGSNPEQWDIEFKEVLQDGGEAMIADPRI